MKTKIISKVGVALCFYFLFSCSKQTDNNVLPSNVYNHELNNSSHKFSEITSFQNREDRMVAYRLLSVPEKVEIWKQHLNYCLQSDEFSQVQKPLIAAALNFLNGKTFASPSLLIDSKDFQTWVGKVVQSFPIKLRSIAFNDVYVTRKINPTSKVNSPMVVAPVDCGCNTGSDFCGTRNFTVGLCSHVFECSGGGCSSSSDGCGWFLLQSCDATCKETIVGNCSL